MNKLEKSKMASANDTMPINNNNNFPVDDDDAITAFPDDDEAGDEEGFANIIKWCEVIENVWLRVEHLVDVNTQYGPAVIVELLKRDGEKKKCCEYWKCSGEFPSCKTPANKS